MSLQTDIKGLIKEAMKTKDEVRLGVIKGLSAAFVNELVAKGKTPQDELDDESALEVIKRAAKQRKEAIEQFEGAGRNDLADKEKAELAILEEFLPDMMDRDEIKKIAEAKAAELGVTDKSGIGQLMGALMGELKGKADGADVKAVIDEILS